MQQKSHHLSTPSLTPPHPNSSLNSATNYKKQRNAFLHHQLSHIIKKQFNIFFINKKLNQQLNNPKNCISMEKQSGIDKVRKFRQMEKRSQWEQLKIFQKKNQERTRKLNNKFIEKSQHLRNKSQLNHIHMTKIRHQHTLLQKQQNLRISHLQHSLTNPPSHHSSTPKPSISPLSTNTIQSHTQTAHKLNNLKQQQTISTYIHKMLKYQSRNLQNQLHNQKTNKQNTNNQQPHKCTLTLRTKQQQKIINSWNQILQKRNEKFQNNLLLLNLSKKQNMILKYQKKNKYREEVSNRRNKINQNISKNRITALENKLTQIHKNSAKSKQNLKLHSNYSFIHKYTNSLYSTNKLQEMKQKQHHQSIMKKIYNIVNKIGNTHNTRSINHSQLKLLLDNLDPNSNSFKQIDTFLHSPLDKFLQQKQKEEQEKLKKNKKLNQKIL